MRNFVLLPLAAAVLTLTGCGTSNPIYGENGLIKDRSQDYEKSQTSQRLEIPPSLRDDTIQMSDRLEVPTVGETSVARKQEFTVPRPEFFYAEAGGENVAMKRDGLDKVLIVDEPIADVWTRVQSYWASRGIKLSESSPREGVMETEWVDTAGKDYGFFDSVVNTVTFRDVEGDVSDKVRVSLRPVEDDYQRTEIVMDHSRVPQEARPATVDWEKSTDNAYKANQMFEMLRFLSRPAHKPTTQRELAVEAQRVKRPQLGRDANGFPALKISGTIDQAWGEVNRALDSAGLDIGTRDQQLGVIYMTYATTTPFDEGPTLGFFEWLHSDREEIKLDTTGLSEVLGLGDSDQDANIKYSSVAEGFQPGSRKGEEKPWTDPTDLSKRKGYKIWLGNRVIYVFGDNEGVINENTGDYEHIGRYQLQLRRTNDGAFLVVKTDKDVSAPKTIAEEILWEVKDNLNQAG
ncbi:outer membrane protein assembly factor BamC [Aliamphritea hakodatensis]|uniref:outer membrane protein assembly factor BamC n=1 Tax=Aliamphritea hakodatensis TaxID=2895352 RepID=UPI0022FDA97E|nr:outer membrane protein assembly factor BamC [Aliamphritea hakodatensis]